jgi:hypothetical protein
MLNLLTVCKDWFYTIKVSVITVGILHTGIGVKFFFKNLQEMFGGTDVMLNTESLPLNISYKPFKT